MKRRHFPPRFTDDDPRAKVKSPPKVKVRKHRAAVKLRWPEFIPIRRSRSRKVCVGYAGKGDQGFHVAQEPMRPLSSKSSLSQLAPILGDN